MAWMGLQQDNQDKQNVATPYQYLHTPLQCMYRASNLLLVPAQSSTLSREKRYGNSCLISIEVKL